MLQQIMGVGLMRSLNQWSYNKSTIAFYNQDEVIVDSALDLFAMRFWYTLHTHVIGNFPAITFVKTVSQLFGPGYPNAFKD